MPDHLDLAQVDTDGAVREAAARIAGDPGLEEGAALGDTAGILRKATCAASCPATVLANVSVSPDRALPATAWR
jgi:hypothetical protein